MSHTLSRAGLAATLCLAALPALAEFRTLEGTVAYRARIAMPPEAVVNVQLVDISLADAPSVMLGAVAVRPGGQVPVGWQLTYDDAMVSDTGRYAVQAEITSGEKTLFRTTQVFPALTSDAPEKVDVMVEMSPKPQMPSLAGTAWIGAELPGVELDPKRVPELTFGPEGRVSGTSGCNRLNGTYESQGQNVTFGQFAVTQMACPGPLNDQERAFFKMLDQVRSYAIEDREMVLMNHTGDVLMRFNIMI
ncbi:META domain-containing protein [Shimia sp.]|uniref:META domain-containing protein n=1 Tax=Shimia sp. TaxID=1954381 RepID=UPI003299D161